jgi:hypothetical protein
MYVVGVIGSDNSLGRTFICKTIAECDAAFAQLLKENGHAHPGYEPFDDECVYCVEDTVYFCGSLEKL